MRLKLEVSGKTVDVSGRKPLSVGGEGKIYELPGQLDTLVKVYLKPTPEHEAKLRAMMKTRPSVQASKGHVSLAWPTDLLLDSANRVVGFAMPRAIGTVEVLDIENAYVRRTVCPNFDYRYLHTVAQNFAAIVSSVHSSGHLVGDVNERNLMVYPNALVTVIDTDSFQVRGAGGEVYPVPVASRDFLAPELQASFGQRPVRSVENDLFSPAILIFKLLMEGQHPYNGTDKQGRTLEELIAYGPPPYVKQRAGFDVPVWPPLFLLHPGICNLVVRCFVDGFSNAKARPSAAEWEKALAVSKSDLIACPKPNHYYGQHLSECPWCHYASQTKVDPFGAPAPKQVPMPQVRGFGTTTRAPRPVPGAAASPPPTVVRQVTIRRTPNYTKFGAGLGIVCAAGWLLVVVLGHISSFLASLPRAPSPGSVRGPAVQAAPAHTIHEATHQKPVAKKHVSSSRQVVDYPKRTPPDLDFQPAHGERISRRSQVVPDTNDDFTPAHRSAQPTSDPSAAPTDTDYESAHKHQ